MLCCHVHVFGHVQHVSCVVQMTCACERSPSHAPSCPAGATVQQHWQPDGSMKLEVIAALQAAVPGDSGVLHVSLPGCCVDASTSVSLPSAGSHRASIKVCATSKSSTSRNRPHDQRDCQSLSLVATALQMPEQMRCRDAGADSLQHVREHGISIHSQQTVSTAALQTCNE